MGKFYFLRVICLVCLLGCAGGAVFAECINEDACFKDHITKKDGTDVVLAVNRDTNEVELYWSNEQNTWLKPDDVYRKELQKIYNKKLQLRSMQAELDRMRREQRPYENQQPLTAGRR